MCNSLQLKQINNQSCKLVFWSKLNKNGQLGNDEPQKKRWGTPSGHLSKLISTTDHKTKTQKLILTCPPHRTNTNSPSEKNTSKANWKHSHFYLRKRARNFPFCKKSVEFFRCGLPPPPKSSFPSDLVLGQSLPCQGSEKNFHHHPIFALSRRGKTFFHIRIRY